MNGRSEIIPELHGAHPAVETAGRELAGALRAAASARFHGVDVIHLGLLGREIGLHFELHAMFERLGRDANAYLAAASEEIVAFCERLLRERPAAEGLPSAKWHANYRRKIEQLKAAV